MRRRTLLLFLIVVFLLGLAAGVSLVRERQIYQKKATGPETSFVNICGDQFCWRGSPIKLKGFNYYSKDNFFAPMWNNWDSNTISKEIALIKSSGVNAIRVGIPLGSNSSDDTYFGWTDAAGNVDPVHLERLVTLIEIAKANGIKVLVTFFDWYFDWNHWPSGWPQSTVPFDPSHSGYTSSFNKSNRYLQTIVSRLKNDSGVLGWDIKNEPFSGGILGSGSPLYWHNPWIMHFLRTSRDYIKSIDVNHPVTIGDESYSEPFVTVQVGNQSYTTNSLVDFLSFHDYTADIQSHINSIKTTSGGAKPILLEEVGWPTADWPGSNGWPTGQTNPADYNESKQNERITAALSTAGSANIAGILIWEFFDHPPNEPKFGIVRLDGTFKPAATAFRDTGAILSTSFPLKIAGTVKSTTGTPIPNVGVRILLDDGNFADVDTNSAGRFVVEDFAYFKRAYAVRIKGNLQSPPTAPSGYVPPATTVTSGWSWNNCSKSDTPAGS